MFSRRLLRIVIAGGLVSVAAFAQPAARLPFAPLPNDPYELVNGGISIPDSPDQRLAAQQIIVKARDQYKLHAGSPFDLKATFNATGQTLYEGPGTLEELFLGMNGSRWTAQLGNYSQTRITGTMGLVYDNRSGPQIPMRLQQLRQAIFSPIYANPQTAFIRAAVVSLGNEELTCVLLSHNSVEPPATPRRRWDETEWCVNSQGLLRIASEVPGLYTVYDYTDSIHFHNLTLPRNITVSEGGTRVLDIHIDSVSDPASLDRAQLAPAPGMITGGPVFHDSVHLIRGIPDGSRQRPTIVKPVVIHATFGPGGTPMEMEIVASSAPGLNAEALDFAKKFRYEIPPPPGAVPEQSQVLLTVRFFSR